MGKDKIKKLENRLKNLKRFKIISKEKVVFKPYYISKLDKEILLNFDKVSITVLSKKLKCHRSYIYSIVEKYSNIYTKEELKRGDFIG